MMDRASRLRYFTKQAQKSALTCATGKRWGLPCSVCTVKTEYRQLLKLERPNSTKIHSPCLLLRVLQTDMFILTWYVYHYSHKHAWHTCLGNRWDDHHVLICLVYVLNILYSVLEFSTTLVLERLNAIGKFLIDIWWCWFTLYILITSNNSNNCIICR